MRTHHPSLQLAITIRQNHIVLPRCLQIFSRRGFTLTALTTKHLNNDEVILHCTLHGPQDWHSSLPQLVEKIIDVQKVEKVEVL